jgi:hypothetical protein
LTKKPRPINSDPVQYHPPDLDGKRFVNFITREEVTVLRRNIYGRLVIRWLDGTVTQISDREFNVAFEPKK